MKVKYPDFYMRLKSLLPNFFGTFRLLCKSVQFVDYLKVEMKSKNINVIVPHQDDDHEPDPHRYAAAGRTDRRHDHESHPGTRRRPRIRACDSRRLPTAAVYHR